MNSSAIGGGAAPDPEESEEAARTPPRVTKARDPERAPQDGPARVPPVPIASPLTGATPVFQAPPPLPFASPLTGATAILPESPPSRSASANLPVPELARGAPKEPPAGRTRGAGRTKSGPAAADDAVASAERARPGRPARRAPLRPSGPLLVRALGAATVELGGTALTPADWGYAKPRELLFLLVTSPPQSREQLGAALWPELSRPQLGNALHTALRELRRALGDHDWIVYAGGRYSVNRDRALDCDVDTFESSLAAASRARSASAGLPDLRRAIAVYGGDFLTGMTTGEWARIRRDELRRRFETALLVSGRTHQEAGNHQAAVVAFRRAVEHEPLNESAHRELMICWAQLGETARAVRHYTELTALLKERVGVPPSPETTALYEKLSRRG